MLLETKRHQQGGIKFSINEERKFSTMVKCIVTQQEVTESESARYKISTSPAGEVGMGRDVVTRLNTIIYHVL